MNSCSGCEWEEEEVERITSGLPPRDGHSASNGTKVVSTVTVPPEVNPPENAVTLERRN